MRVVRVAVGRLLAGTLLTLCIGVQALEATGLWDQTLTDASDEAAIVAMVLCVGAAVAVARAPRHRLSFSRSRSEVVVGSTTPAVSAHTSRTAFSTSPPLARRI